MKKIAVFKTLCLSLMVAGVTMKAGVTEDVKQALTIAVDAKFAEWETATNAKIDLKETALKAFLCGKFDHLKDKAECLENKARCIKGKVCGVEDLAQCVDGKATCILEKTACLKEELCAMEVEVRSIECIVRTLECAAGKSLSHITQLAGLVSCIISQLSLN